MIDDSENPEIIYDKNIDYHILPFNQGSSYGRNFALDKTRTKYFLYLDDDYYFGPKTDIARFITLFEKHELDVLAGNFIQNCIPRHYEYQLRQEETVLHFISKPKEILNNNIFLYDIVQNFFIAETQKVRSIEGWDNRFKTEEHTDFFLKLKSLNWRVGYCPDLVIHHKPLRGKNYMQYRKNRRYFDLYDEKYGIKHIIYDDLGSKLNFKRSILIMYDFIIRQFQ